MRPRKMPGINYLMLHDYTKLGRLPLKGKSLPQRFVQHAFESANQEVRNVASSG